MPGWPIPFFGDLQKAHILTVGVNPASGEFEERRKWDQVTRTDAWRNRAESRLQSLTLEHPGLDSAKHFVEFRVVWHLQMAEPVPASTKAKADEMHNHTPAAG